MPSFAEVKVLQQQNMLNVHHMHTWVCTVFKWNYGQHLYTHTLIPIINGFASTNEPLNDILWPGHIQWQPPTDQTLYGTRPFTEFWEVFIKHIRRVWHADRGRLLLRAPGPVPLFYLLRPILFPNLSLLLRTTSSNIPRYFLDFALHNDCGLTKDGQLEKQQPPSWCGYQMLNVTQFYRPNIWSSRSC